MSTKYKLVVNEEDQIEILYDLLKQRTHGISHSLMPGFREHTAFVRSKPYRAWYIVTNNNIPVGSFYITNENVVGINIKDSLIEALLKNMMNYILEHYQPLTEIKSIRANRFICNISPKNVILRKAFDRLNKDLLQLTYSFE